MFGSNGCRLSEQPRNVRFKCLSPQRTSTNGRGVPDDPHAKPCTSGCTCKSASSASASEGSVARGGERHPDVPHLIAEWLEEIALIRDAEPLQFPEALARIHAQFEQIHPFLDGNGRAGRLVLNLLLGRLGYPPAIIYKRERAHYLNALRRADRGDHGALGELLARAVLHNLHKFVVPAIAGPARLVPLPALADDVLSADALRVAAARGRLEASKGADGTWRSSRTWVDAYKASRRRRG